ncbi:hypothetical protein ACQVTS_32460 [Bacillus mycoides]
MVCSVAAVTDGLHRAGTKRKTFTTAQPKPPSHSKNKYETKCGTAHEALRNKKRYNTQCNTKQK